MVKRIYNENQSLKEMAIINPRLCNQLTIQVEIEQRDEGPIPHVHVYHDKTRNPKECSYIRLDKCAYSEHHKDKVSSCEADSARSSAMETPADEPPLHDLDVQI